MRYAIIFLITIVISLFIIYYKPYLGVYSDTVTITLDSEYEDFNWTYEIDNDNLVLLDQKNNSWTFKINKKGVSNLYFYYSRGDYVRHKIYYKFKTRGNKIFWLEGYGEGLLSYPNPK
jgi:hypothetical protein